MDEELRVILQTMRVSTMLSALGEKVCLALAKHAIHACRFHIGIAVSDVLYGFPYEETDLVDIEADLAP